jgi:hypothetical protein
VILVITAHNMTNMLLRKSAADGSNEHKMPIKANMSADEPELREITAAVITTDIESSTAGLTAQIDSTAAADPVSCPLPTT